MGLLPEQDRRLTDLMVRSQKGEKTAYAALLAEIAPLLLRYAAARLDSFEAAEDVVQETLVSIHQARQTYVAGRPFAPWMYAIVRYRIADYWRRQSRRVSCDPLEPAMEPALTDQTIGTRDGLAEKVRDVLQGLPEKQRTLVRLVKLEGLSFREAAVRLGMSEGAVKVAAHRAYEQLRQKFEDSTDEDERNN